MIAKSIQYKIAAFLSVLYGAYTFSAGSDEAKASAEIEKHGISAPGTLVKAKSSTTGVKRSTRYLMQAAFQTGNGEARQLEMEVSSGFFDERIGPQIVSGNFDGGMSTGTVYSVTNPDVEIRYLPHSPSRAIIVGAGLNHTGAKWFGIALAVGGLVGLVYMFVYEPFEE